MTDLQSRIGASEGVSMVGTQFDGQIPPGETPAAAAAVAFAIAQVGKPFSDKDGVGPKFSRNGLVWRAWKEAGSKWPLASANTQALNRKWVVPIEPGQEKPGDLVFWRLNNATDLPGRIDHVGLVVNRARECLFMPRRPKLASNSTTTSRAATTQAPPCLGASLTHRRVQPRSPGQLSARIRVGPSANAQRSS